MFIDIDCIYKNIVKFSTRFVKNSITAIAILTACYLIGDKISNTFSIGLTNDGLYEIAIKIMVGYFILLSLMIFICIENYEKIKHCNKENIDNKEI